MTKASLASSLHRARKAEMVARYRAMKHSAAASNSNGGADDDQDDKHTSAENTRSNIENKTNRGIDRCESDKSPSSERDNPNDELSATTISSSTSTSILSFNQMKDIAKTSTNNVTSTSSSSSSQNANRGTSKSRAAAIADTKKKLAAARMISISRSLDENERTILPAVSSIKSEESETELIEKLHKSTLGVKVKAQSISNFKVETNDLFKKNSLIVGQIPSSQSKYLSAANPQPHSQSEPKKQIETNESIQTSIVTPVTTRANRLSRLRSRSPAFVSRRTDPSNEGQLTNEEFSTENATSKKTGVHLDNDDCHAEDPEPAASSGSNENDDFDLGDVRSDNVTGQIQNRLLKDNNKTEDAHATFNRKTNHTPYSPHCSLSASLQNTSNQYAPTRFGALKAQRDHYLRMKAAPKKLPRGHATESRGKHDYGGRSRDIESSLHRVKEGVQVDFACAGQDFSSSSFEYAEAEKQAVAGYNFFGDLTSSEGGILSDGILTQIYDGKIGQSSQSSQLARTPSQMQPSLHSDSFQSVAENSSSAAFHAFGHPTESVTEIIKGETMPSHHTACPDPPLEHYSTASTSTDSPPLLIMGVGEENVGKDGISIEEDKGDQVQNSKSDEIEEDDALSVASTCTKELTESIDLNIQTSEQGKPQTSNEEWPSEDAFSPTSWGSQTGFSSGEKWDQNTATDPFQYASPRNNDGVQWNRCNNRAAVQWVDVSEIRNEDEKSAFSVQNRDSLPQQSPRLTNPWDDNDDEREEWSRYSRSSQIDARDDMEAQAGNLVECEQYRTDEGVQYEGVGTSMDSDNFNCNECRDDSNTSDDRDEFNMEINLNISQETAGSATEFDPISIFEGCESVSPEMNADFPEDEVDNDCEEDNNVDDKKNNSSNNSLISWTSPKLLIPDDSQSKILGMKQTPLSTIGGNEVTGAVGSPSGAESLESWWQNKYASTQNYYVNAAVHEALSKQEEFPRENSPRVSKIRPISRNMGLSSKNSLPLTISRVPLQSQAKLANTNYSKLLPESPNSEEDSIFSGIDDNSSKSFKVSYAKYDIVMHRGEDQLQPADKTKSLHDSRNDDETDDEDIFSGVQSVSSRHSIHAKDRKPGVMKSLMDSLSTNEGQPSRDHHGAQGRCITQNSVLFSPDRGYGIIDVKNIDGKSPTGASVTSDITTSVIFGGDFSKKVSLRFGAMERDYGHISEATDECVTKEETSLNTESPTEQSISHNNRIVQLAEDEKLEDADPHKVSKEGHPRPNDFLKENIRGRSLMSPSTTDSVTNPSQSSSFLKKAFLLAKTKTANDESDATNEHSKCNPIKDSLSKAKSSIFSHFSCGILGASSFALCAMNAGNEGVKDADSCVSPSNLLGGEVKIINPGLGAVNGGTLGKNGFERGRSDTSASRSISETLTGTVETDIGTPNQNKADQSISETLSRTNETEIETLDRTRASCSITETLSDTVETGTILLDQSHTEDENSDYDNDCNKSTSSEDSTYDEHDDPTASTREGNQTQATSESLYEQNGTLVSKEISLSNHEKVGSNEWKNKVSSVQVHDQAKAIAPTLEVQSQAYEKLLLHAYTALSMPPPSEIIEKGEASEVYDATIKPPFRQRGREEGLRSDALNVFFERINESGMEVLKLNREKKWQQRFLTITKEVLWFKKNENNGRIDSCPRGLLWVKNTHSKERSVDNIGKNGRGGVLFANIESVSVTKDDFPLNRKQKRGKFKDSYTFVLHSNVNGSCRDILFRCEMKEDVCILSAGFHEILDRIKNDKMMNLTQIREPLLPLSTNANDRIRTPLQSPTAATKAFSPKAAAGPAVNDRWEV